MQKSVTAIQKVGTILAIIALVLSVGSLIYINGVFTSIDDRLKKLEGGLGAEEKVVLRIGLSVAFETPDPPEWWSDYLNGIGQLVCEPLTRLWEEDGKLVIKPVLAESWEQIDDVTWVFHLRKDVKFSDGSPFTAQDVWFSIWGRQNPRPSNLIWSIDARVQDCVIVDNYTIKFITKSPIPNFPIWVSHGWTSIISYEQVKRSGQLNAVPISGVENVLGTGPYKWVEIQPSLYAKMTLNPYWRGAKPQITDVEIYYLPDDEARVAALETGAVHYITPVPPEAIDRLKQKGFTLWTRSAINFHNLGFVTVLSPTDNVKVRQAIAYAINRDEMLSSIYGAAAEPLNTVVPRACDGAGDFPIYSYNPEKARQLLAEAGYPDGCTVRMAYRAGEFSHVDEVVAAIVGYLAKVGINVQVDILERSKLRAETIGNRYSYLHGENVTWTYNMAFDDWSTDTLWAGDDMWSKYTMDSDHNWFMYDNPVVDELIRTSVSLAPYEQRLNATLEAQRIMMEDCVIVPLFGNEYVGASTPKYKGHVIMPNCYEYFGQGVLER